MPIMDGFQACKFIVDSYNRYNYNKIIYGDLEFNEMKYNSLNKPILKYDPSESLKKL
jgi:hypothetical protein